MSQIPTSTQYWNCHRHWNGYGDIAPSAIFEISFTDMNDLCQKTNEANYVW